MTRERGFTLPEVLAVLVLLGLLSLMLGQSLRFGMMATDRRDRVAFESADLDAVDGLIRRLIEQADPGTEDNPAGFVGTPRTLTLRSELPSSFGPEAGRRIIGVLGVDDQKRLVLRWSPYLHAARLGGAPSQSAVLLEGVTGLDLSYWVRPKPKLAPVWVTAVTAVEPPPLIRLRLVFADGSKRSWPDIFAAPHKQRPLE
jgi:general secretion pathway protein J